MRRLLALLFLAAPACAADFPARVVRIHDGDTLVVDVLAWPPEIRRQPLRLEGVDAPELGARARCPSEAAAAIAARDALRLLAPPGAAVTLHFAGPVAFEKYGRLLANVRLADGRDAGNLLLHEGRVRPYAGGRPAGWCEAPLGQALPRRAWSAMTAPR